MPKNDSLESEQLTDATYYILLSLVQERHGYAIMQYVNDMTNNQFNLGPATLYTLLKKLDESGYIKQTESMDRKKTYILTEKGKILLEKELDRREEMVRHGREILQGELTPCF